MARQWDYVRLLQDVDGYLLPDIPAGTYGVIVEAYEVPSEGYDVDVAIRDPDTGERLYDNVVLRPEQFRVLLHGCALDIDSAVLDAPAIIDLMKEAFTGSARGRTVTTSAVAIELDGPLPREAAMEARGSRDFNYQAHIEGRPGVALDDVVAAVSTLLDTLWGLGIPAVARCDYADRLPRGSGYELWDDLRPGERDRP